MDTQFFEKDIKTVLQSCKNNIPITGIFLPMVRDYSQILTLNEILSDGDYNLEIVPMIETVKGYRNISNILNEDKNYNLISRVHYGHFDYCLDAGLWPFPDPCHFEYWEIVQNLVGIVHGYGKTYVHTPFPFPQDEQLFWWTSNKLQKLSPNGESVMCTVNTGLSPTFYNVAFGYNTFVAVGDGGKPHTSLDNGSTWTLRNSPTTTFLMGVSYKE